MILELHDSICPGCGLALPVNGTVTYDGYYHVSQECWGVYTRVMEKEFSNPILFKQIHSLTVDTYAVQHAGGNHKDKSVAVHLTGLHLMLDRGIMPSKISGIHQLLGRRVKKWAKQVWKTWLPQQNQVRKFVTQYLNLD